jgi:SAM-dependent methyltransferase
VSQAGQTLRDERIARVIDREVAPLWHDRFARMIWRHLGGESPNLVLDVHCGSGRTTAEILERFPGARVMAIEPDAPQRELAKARTSEWKDRVYLKAGNLVDVAALPAASYDLVIANLVLGEIADTTAVLRELARVTKPGGQVLATLPLHGTWTEAEDLYREVLRDAQLRDVVRRLRRLAQLRPTGHELARALGEVGIRPDHFVIEQERFELLFSSGREFLFSPVVELGPLRMWKSIIGDSGKPQELFWRLKESIDAYFAGHVLAVTVVAGLLRLRVPVQGAATAHGAAEMTGEYWRRWPELDALWQTRERIERAAAVGTPTDLDVDIDIDTESPSEEQPALRAPLVDASASHSSMSMSAEDQAIFALLEQPLPPSSNNEELDALLDQVLEFAAAREDVTELEEDELEEHDQEQEPPRRAGDTLSRIRALIPPPPVIPPPVPGKKR